VDYRLIKLLCGLMLVSNLIAECLDSLLDLPRLLVLLFKESNNLRGLYRSKIRSKMCFYLIN
jgi:hypothetical protein